MFKRKCFTAYNKMSSGARPPLAFDGADFSYWNIRMEAYIDAIDSWVLKAAEEGFPNFKDPIKHTSDKANYEKWNAKARNIFLRGLNKESFNQVRSEKTAHKIWEKLVEIHMRSKDETEERHQVIMDNINAFKMLLMKGLTKCILACMFL